MIFHLFSEKSKNCLGPCENFLRPGEKSCCCMKTKENDYENTKRSTKIQKELGRSKKGIGRPKKGRKIQKGVGRSKKG